MSGEARVKRKSPSAGLPASFWPLATSTEKDSPDHSETESKGRPVSRVSPMPNPEDTDLSSSEDFLTVSSGMSFDDLLFSPPKQPPRPTARPAPSSSANVGPTHSFYPQVDKPTKGKDVSIDVK